MYIRIGTECAARVCTCMCHSARRAALMAQRPRLSWVFGFSVSWGRLATVVGSEIAPCIQHHVPHNLCTLPTHAQQRTAAGVSIAAVAAAAYSCKTTHGVSTVVFLQSPHQHHSHPTPHPPYIKPTLNILARISHLAWAFWDRRAHTKHTYSHAHAQLAQQTYRHIFCKHNGDGDGDQDDSGALVQTRQRIDIQKHTHQTAYRPQNAHSIFERFRERTRDTQIII